MKKSLRVQAGYALMACLMFSTDLYAQFTFTGQFRPRFEFRDGQGSLTPAGAVPAAFISQRSRLNFGYKGYRFRAFAAVQDVRVWGQDASSINRITGAGLDGVMLHEAWGELSLIDTTSSIENLSLKIGRQELVYDDARLLGNLDWLQQGRRHDLALLKFENKGWMAHLGVAFNQNSELKIGNTFNGAPTGYAAGTNDIGSLYKSMQFLYLGRKFYAGNFSFLLLKDDFNQYNSSTRVLERGVWSRVTLGGYLAATALKKIGVSASAYYQTGKDKTGMDLSSYMFTASALYAAGRKISIGPGIDYLSGGVSDGKNKNFDPLYGTPHKFWGLMDYFYVADRFGNNGLLNAYLKTRYKAKDNLLLSLDLHQFFSANAVAGTDGASLDRNFGSELDLILTYNMTKAITVEGGYCTFFATPTLASPAVKNVPNADLQANWAYVMVTIKPDFLAK